MRAVAALEEVKREKTAVDFAPLVGRVGGDIAIVYLILQLVGCAGRVGFDGQGT
jgi:hypothetical protein